MKTFNEVKDFLSDIPYIHRGGCGISALAMYRWLKKNRKSKIKFVYLYYSDTSSYNQNEMALHNIYNDPVACSHAGILYRNKMIDCRGDINLNKYSNTKIHIIDDENFIIRSVNRKIEWNDSFRRRGNITKISKKLKIDLSDIIK